MSKRANNPQTTQIMKGVKIWALVAHRAGADIFSKSAVSTPCTAVMHLLHPDGRLKDRDMNTDRGGRTKDRKGKGKHAMSKENVPTVQKAKAFAKDLSKIIESARTTNKFDKLVLVAPSNFLGFLQSALSKTTAKLVLETHKKDFMTMEEKEIKARVDALLTSLYPSPAQLKRAAEA